MKKKQVSVTLTHFWSLSDSNGIRTHNHLVRKRTLRVFGYELRGCGFESRYCHLNLRYRTCFEQEVS